MEPTSHAHTAPSARRLFLTLLVAVGLLGSTSACRQLGHLFGEPGAPCATEVDCSEGLTCLTEAEGFPGGYCTNQTCTADGCPGMFAECILLDRSRNVTACLEGCSSNIDCVRSGYICADMDSGDGSRACLPEARATTGAGALGSSCGTDADCGDNLTCLTNFVFGYCSSPCSSDAECGADGHCVDQGAGTLRCMDACSNNEQCRFGYACVDRGSGGVCDADDSSGAVRNPAGATDGQACTQDIACQGGVCIVGDDFPDGYCTTRDCDVVGCSGSSSTCVNLQRDSLCFVDCTDSADCREGYRCTSLESGGNVCYALSPIRAPEAGGTGPIQVRCDATSSGNTRSARFTIGASTVGFAVVPFSPGQSEVIPTRMTLPDGTRFNFESDYAFQTINSLLLATIVPMSFPAAPQFDRIVQAGEYVFEYETDDTQSCYYVLEQPDVGTRLDVNFYFVGVPGVRADNAGAQSNFQAVLDEFTTIYTGAGISVGTVRYFDISGADLERYRIIREFGDIYRLLSLSRSPGESTDEALSVNVFLIEDFNIGELPGLLGLSAGIPGVPGVHGSGGSGLVFTSADMGSDPASLGQTMAHEVGHFLGLRHTSERGGAEYDPLGDTPQCSDPESAFGCPDVSNLMFPFSVDVEQRQLTANQRFVLQRNPLVK